jgi:hypothetical protein
MSAIKSETNSKKRTRSKAKIFEEEKVSSQKSRKITEPPIQDLTLNNGKEIAKT